MTIAGGDANLRRPFPCRRRDDRHAVAVVDAVDTVDFVAAVAAVAAFVEIAETVETVAFAAYFDLQTEACLEKNTHTRTNINLMIRIIGSKKIAAHNVAQNATRHTLAYRRRAVQWAAADRAASAEFAS